MKIYRFDMCVYSHLSIKNYFCVNFVTLKVGLLSKIL